MIKPFSIFFSVVLFFILIACTPKSILHEYKQLPSEGWYKDSTANFEVTITDTSAHYKLFLNIRNKSDYPYQNFWTFITTMSPDSTVTTDSIECYLANTQGKWLGSGISSLYEMQVLLENDFRFKTQGKYYFTIRQGMRDDLLKGISDIGLEIQKK